MGIPFPRAVLPPPWFQASSNQSRTWEAAVRDFGILTKTQLAARQAVTTNVVGNVIHFVVVNVEIVRAGLAAAFALVRPGADVLNDLTARQFYASNIKRCGQFKTDNSAVF